MNKLMLSFVVGMAVSTAEASMDGYMSHLYAGTVYADADTLLVQPEPNDIGGYMVSLYDETIYSTAYTFQPQLSEADIAAENEVNGYFQEWDDKALSEREENGYWM
ncbi:MAG: hypothetical protein HN344_06415 [Gammaproteobacteria bacterium]|jgi:hypothetical protein|nr:hypothetical protein [Gammaproteobacteria bacterium]